MARFGWCLGKSSDVSCDPLGGRYCAYTIRQRGVRRGVAPAPWPCGCPYQGRPLFFFVLSRIRGRDAPPERATACCIAIHRPWSGVRFGHRFPPGPQNSWDPSTCDNRHITLAQPPSAGPTTARFRGSSARRHCYDLGRFTFRKPSPRSPAKASYSWSQPSVRLCWRPAYLCQHSSVGLCARVCSCQQHPARGRRPHKRSKQHEPPSAP